jgi:hypothetical protein
MLAIAWFRGLPGNIAALKADLRTAPGPAPSRPKAASAAYAPEPEGYFEPRLYGAPRDTSDHPGVQSNNS